MEIYTIINGNKFIIITINNNKFTHDCIVNIFIFNYNLTMSVRKIKKSYISCTGYFKSFKNQNQIAFESVLERNFYLLLEFDPMVQSYYEQPFTLKYELNGKKSKYTPDSLVNYYDDSQKVFEVKYQKDIDTDTDLQEKLNVLKTIIPMKRSLPFEIFTDHDIQDDYLNNAQFLYHYAFLPANDSYTTKIQRILKNSHETITVKQLLKTISSHKNDHLNYLPYIWHEVFKNISLIDIHQRLTMNTILKGNSNE